MAINFIPLKVINFEKNTSDSCSITFEIGDEHKEVFRYKPGQYITVKIPINDLENRRAYSISSSPFETNNITITIKKVDEGLVSNYLFNNIKINDILDVMPPLGKFTFDFEPPNHNTYVLIGGGSGITPLISLIKSILKVESHSKIYLFYQNRTKDSIIFENELNLLQKQHKERFEIIYYLSKPHSEWTGNKGRITNLELTREIKNLVNDNIYKAEYFICGPAGLMDEVELTLKNLMIASHKIHKESFIIELNNKEKRNDIILGDAELEPKKIKIILYGEELDLTVNPDENVITAAQRAGYDPPYSCQIGACSTCRAKLKSGKVSMDERDSLTDEEIEEGYIVTCQSHPLTDDVIIDYDDN